MMGLCGSDEFRSWSVVFEASLVILLSVDVTANESKSWELLAFECSGNCLLSSVRSLMNVMYIHGRICGQHWFLSSMMLTSLGFGLLL